MKLTKKTWIIIAAVAVVGVAGFIVWKKKKAAAMEVGEKTGQPGEEKAPETAKAGTAAAPATAKATPSGVPVSSILAAQIKTQPGTVLKSQVPIKTTAAPVTTYTAPTTSKIVPPVAKPVVIAPAKVVTPAAKPVITAPAKAATPAKAPVIAIGKYSKAVKDAVKGIAILHVTPKKVFIKGSKVKVAGKVYNGTYNVTNVYTGNATVDAIYIDVPFKADDTGTLTKV